MSMRFRDNWQRLRAFWPATFLALCPILYLVRSRLLVARESLPKNIEHWLIAPGEDILVLAVLSLLFYFLFRPLLAFLATTLFLFLNTIAVIFYVKMEHPLTRELLSQTGNIFSLRTSIFDQSQGRLMWQLASVLALFCAISFVLYRWRNKFAPLFFPLLSVSLIFGLVTVSLGRSYRVWTYNSFLGSVLNWTSQHPQELDEITKYLGRKPSKLQYETFEARTNEPRKNVVVVVLETASFNLGADQDRFSQVMPFLSSLMGSPHATNYLRHYTPWPFSSKSLYSFTCSHPPLLSNVIEFRIFPEKQCANWLGQLAQAGYQAGVFYSGDLLYDNMGQFFRAQGASYLWDRTKAKAEYESNSWGVDDAATIQGFLEWAPTNKEFAALLIPINSHHPYWIPKSSTAPSFSDPYLNSFSYQDQKLRDLFNGLKERKLLKNTVLIITGDHGRQFNAGAGEGELVHSFFHVPLVVYDEIDSSGIRQVTFPTSHMDLSGAILEKANVTGRYLKGHNLRTPKPVFSFYQSFDLLVQVVSEEEGVVLYNVDQGEFRYAKKWGEKPSETCSYVSCENSKQWLADFYWTALRTGRDP